MSDLIVLSFDNEASAFQMRDKLLDMQKQQVITLSDAAIVIRDKKGKPKVKQLHSLVGAGAMGGAFWGMLIGLLFFAPWLGMAAGALGGALGGKFNDIGVDDKFIKEVGETIEPGHAALFLLVVKVTADKVLPELASFNAKVLQTSLSNEDEARLRETFGAEDVEA
ncbi:MAG: DUF1269 domain-containing protein [Chloroflexi bacterium]|nr:DUF1269 domain-containing protein [Chloroflexota bacterium]MBK6709940.1 DUF1269 domain-containing protein [Chloroflexota bacterium]MBK7178758.1 DUF1269 domain-containing protein [Chloroflexota bacterium]MBK7917265.1 DUF1269 domain-containing protein [Chloroflexota bacterium]MBK8932552.1 DUF1269 domain-containing protein [Chloroflexota bacterium]